jgi:hypothetical protein
MRTFFLLLVSLFALPGQAAPVPDVQALLDKHLQAVGPIESVQSRRLRLRLIGIAPMELPVMIEASRPNLIRKELSLHGSVQITAFDGKQGWKTDPFVPGGDKPSGLPAAEAKALVQEADFDGALVRPAAKGIRIAYAGPAVVDGKPAHTLKMTLADGTPATVWLDAASHLEVKRTQHGLVMGTLKPIDIYSSDYRDVGGVRIAHRVEIGLAGSKDRMKILVDKAELNVPVDAARYARP